MAALKDWILAVTAAALLTAAVQSLMPSGAVKAAGSLACGLLLFLTAVRPLAGAGWEDIRRDVAAFQRELAQTQSDLTATGQDLRRAVILRRSEAYSRDVSAGLDVEVTIDWDWSAEPPAPVRATVTGPLAEAEREALTARLMEDLGLGRNQIVLTDTEEEP